MCAPVTPLNAWLCNRLYLTRYRLPRSSTADVMTNDVMYSNCFFGTFPLNNVRASRQLADTVTEAGDMAIRKTRGIESSQATALQPPVISFGPISLRWKLRLFSHSGMVLRRCERKWPWRAWLTKGEVNVMLAPLELKTNFVFCISMSCSDRQNTQEMHHQ